MILTSIDEIFHEAKASLSALSRSKGQLTTEQTVFACEELEKLRLKTHALNSQPVKKLDLPSFQLIDNELGKKFDADKTEYHLLPLHALEQVNKVLMYGAKKYGANNWQNVCSWQHRYYNATLRHIFQWQAGEKFDPETNITHLAHAICSLMFLIEKQKVN